MRTPNATCIICQKPLYRRPSDSAKARFAACFIHRADAQKLAGITEAQNAALQLGRPKGTNHRTGYKHLEQSKSKASAANKAYWKSYPHLAIARGTKISGENAYNWKGGAAKLNTSIRQMTENRRWMDAVKFRDKKCVQCASTERLQSHHIIPLASLIAAHEITSREDARRIAHILWDLQNGKTLCEPCHYAEHNRKMPA